MTEAFRRSRRTGLLPTAELRRANGEAVGTVSLHPDVFGIEPHVPVMHQVVNAQLGAARAGTQSTKTRADVEGGSAKPWRQKGTGRARAGSVRAPQFSGGGVALGPKPRSYKQKTPKKMVQLALHSALSDRAAAGKVLVVNEWNFTEPKTRNAKAFLAAVEISGSALLVMGAEDVNAMLSFRNLPNVHIVPVGELNTFDVLRYDVVVFTEATLPGAAMSADEVPVRVEIRGAAQ